MWNACKPAPRRFGPVRADGTRGTPPGDSPRAVLALLAAAALALGLAACGDGGDAGTDSRPAAGTPASIGAGPADPDIRELEWDALIPPDWRPDQLFAEYDLDAIDDDDPRAGELMDKLKRLWAEAPVVAELDGRRVRLPGFVVPLDMEATRIAEFLLVPYYGACIHVPPPPANQTVYVKLPPEAAFVGQMFDTVWVTGTLKVSPTQSDLADAGYRIDATAIAPYEGDVEPM